MKKLLILLIAALLLSSCDLFSSRATVSDSEMETRVAKVLTEYATATPEPPAAVTPTMPLPTLAFTDTLPPVTETPQPQTTEPPLETTEPAMPSATPTEGPTPTATNTSAPTPTTVPGDPRADLGAPDWLDTMEKDTNWPTGTDAGGFTSIAFKDGFMELTGLQVLSGWRLATTGSLGNAYIEMTVNSGACKGEDRFGIIFRVPVLNEANRGYLFGINCAGKFSLASWDATEGADGTWLNLILWKQSDAILAGANQVNRLGVKATGSRLKLYINGMLVGEVIDTKFTTGYFGIFVGARQTTNYTIKVDEMAYWLNP